MTGRARVGETCFVAASRAPGLRFRPPALWSGIAVLIGIAGAGGCSSSQSCHVLADTLDCKPTFDEQAALGRDFQPPRCATGGPCGAHMVWMTPSPDYFNVICVYDSSGRRLLSATTCSDVPLACGDFCMMGGQSIDPGKECDLSTLPQICTSPDAGM
ncbi:MAG TPA: hypothetical protein VIF57_26765 [Polyangia bacterium]